MSVGNRHPIQLIEMVQTTGAARNTTEADGNIYNTWAEVKRISGNRAFSRGFTQLEEGLYFKTRFRFTYNPDAKYKVVYQGHRHTVKSIEKEGERQFYWIIMANTAHD